MARAATGMWRLLRSSTPVIVCSVLAACSGLTRFGLLGENFPPHDIAFARYVAPEFPYRLRATAIGSGYAIVVITVSADGRVSDAVAVEASHEAFVTAVLDVVPQWVLLPDESETTPRREVLHFEFRRSGVVSSVSHREAARKPFAEIEAGQPAVRLVSAADYMPARLQPDAAQTGRFTSAGATGVADVSFIIDEDGRVRVPVAADSSDPVLAGAALQLVRRWRFEPPRIDGRPVVVEVARSVTFSPAK